MEELRRPRRRRAAQLREDGAGHRRPRRIAGATGRSSSTPASTTTRKMSDEILDDLGLPRSRTTSLGVGSGTHGEQTGKVLIAFERGPARGAARRVVVVAGDVNSTLACALAASKLGIPVAHLESGLRSGDWTMPEEINRVLTDRLSDLLLTHSPEAEGTSRRGRSTLDRDPLRRQHDDRLAPPLRGQGARRAGRGRAPRSTSSSYMLVTLHRPSNVDEPDAARRDRRTRLSTLARATRSSSRSTRAPARGSAAAGDLDRLEAAGVHCIEPARLPRLPVAAGGRGRDRHRLRRRPGGGLRVRRPLLHAARRTPSGR